MKKILYIAALAVLFLNVNLRTQSLDQPSNFNEDPVLLGGNDIPKDYWLGYNHPNPFNPSTKINFSIAASETRRVTLIVFDILGREITTLVNRDMNAGTYEINFDASGLPSGIYFYTLRAGNFAETKKMLMLK